MRWHYMTPRCFRKALEKGALCRPAQAPKECGLLWFCDREVSAEIAGTVRIGVQAKTAPLDWHQAISRSRMGPYLADTLARIVREQGTDLCQWYATVAAVPQELWCTIEMWHDAQWHPLNTPDEKESEFDEQVCEVQADGKRYLLRKNAAEARKARHRLDEKLATLRTLVAARNAKVVASPRCQPAAGLRSLQGWVQRHQLSTIVALALDERQITLAINAAAQEQALQLAGWYVLETDVPADRLDTQTAHDHSKALAPVEHDLRPLKTGLPEVRPMFVRQENRTRGHVFVGMLALQLSRELQQRVATAFGTTKDDLHGVTVQDALAALHRQCLLRYPLDDTYSITRLPRPDAQQSRMLQALRVSLRRQAAVDRSGAALPSQQPTDS
jgi:hypothetical protein